MTDKRVGPFAGVRILIADDFEPWRIRLRKLLSVRSEWQIVCEVCDGYQAVRKATELHPNIVLLDIGMPRLNGIEAARRIRQYSPESKILFVTQTSDKDILSAALGTGAEGYVLKANAASKLVPAIVTALHKRRLDISRALAGNTFAEISDYGPVPSQRHVVQFYEDDAVLLDELAALFRGSLGEGRSVAAIITSSHRSGLEKRLRSQGIDVSAATQNGQLCLLDTDEALSEFMMPDGPSRDRFLSRFGSRLRMLKATTLAKGSGPVLFGEMVAVLWAQKKYDAAIRLEELWNELALTNSFYLCCAYPANTFRDKLTAERYTEICAQHSQVVSAFDRCVTA